jgi:hypothetical protein
MLTREEASFHSTKQQATGNQATIALYNTRQCRNDSPGDGDEGDPARRSELLQDKVGGDFRQNIGYEKDRDCRLELSGIHTKILLKAIESSVADVYSGVELGLVMVDSFGLWIRVCLSMT